MNPAPPPVRHRELWSLREDTAVDLPDGGGVLLSGVWGEVRLADPGRTVREALRRMSYGPVSLRNIVTDFPDHDTPAGEGLSPASAGLSRALAELQWLLIRSIDLDGTGLLLSVVPLTGDVALHPRTPDPELALVLAPLTELQWNPQGVRLEAPQGCYRAEVHHPAAVTLVRRLDRPRTPTELAEHMHPDLPAATVRTLLAFLVATGLVTAAPAKAIDGPHSMASVRHERRGSWPK
jgi:hypothetical protein